MGLTKACPIVLRRTTDEIQILAFQHPKLDRQLVKGTIEPNEQPSNAAIRELAEESGLIAKDSPLYLGESVALPDGNHWYFYCCEVLGEIPEEWTFHTEDEGGLLFRFFWHTLDAELDESWHPLFHDVFSVVRPLILQHSDLLRELK